jgi:hypothetical protein
MKKLTRNQMITLENILEKMVENLTRPKFQEQYTVNEILEIREIYKAVVSDNQTPTGAQTRKEDIYRG